MGGSWVEADYNFLQWQRKKVFPCLHLIKIFEPIYIDSLTVFKGSYLIVSVHVTSDIKNPIIYVSTPSLCVRVLICVRDEFRFSY